MTINPTHNENDQAEVLLQILLNAKIAEGEAKQARLTAEMELLPFLDCKDEGSATTQVGDFKVTVTSKVSRTCSAAGFAGIRKDIPDSLQPIEIKDALSLKGIRWLQANEPELYKKLAQHITAKPGKPSITIKA
jgi:hypothetical protein